MPAQPEPPTRTPEAAAAVAEWRETGANVQLLLLQHHLLACLQCALQKAAAGASLAADRVQQLLMADWVLLHRGQDWLDPELLDCALQASHCLLVPVPLAACLLEVTASTGRCSDWRNLEVREQAAAGVSVSDPPPRALKTSALSMLHCILHGKCGCKLMIKAPLSQACCNSSAYVAPLGSAGA